MSDGPTIEKSDSVPAPNAATLEKPVRKPIKFMQGTKLVNWDEEVKKYPENTRAADTNLVTNRIPK